MSDKGVYVKSDLRSVCGISMTQVDRLERCGKFPARFPISGDAPNSKKAWLREAVHKWIEERATKRQGLSPFRR